MSVAEEFDQRIDGQDYEGAMAVLSKAWHSQHENSFYLSNMGWLLNQMNRPSEALTYLAKAISLFSEDPWNYSQIAYSYQLLNRDNEALEFYKKAIDHGSDDNWVNSRIAGILAGLDRHEEAIDYYQNAIMDNPSDIDSRLNLGNSFCALHKYEEAIEEWTMAFQMTRDESIIENSILTLFRENEYQLTKKLLSLIPSSNERFYFEATIAFEEHNYQDSVKNLLKSLEVGIDHTGIRQLLSDAYFELGDEEKAFEQLRIKRNYWIKSVERQADDIDSMQHIAITSITLHDYDTAFKYLEMALKYNENDVITIYHYCNLLVYTKRYEEAIPYFEKLRELDPESSTPESMYNEAYSYFYLANYRKAIEVVENFRKQNKKYLKAFMLELMAESYYNIGEYEKCIEESKNALALNKELNIYRLMASAQEQMKDYQAAGESILEVVQQNLMNKDFYNWAKITLKRIKNKEVLKIVNKYWKEISKSM